MAENERRNITQPSDWWAAFAYAAEQEGQTLSAWIGEACKEQVPFRIRNTLSERRSPGQTTVP